MLNYMRQFIKIRLVSHTLYLWNEAGDPDFFYMSDTCDSLSNLSKNFLKIYRVENFRANVLKLNAWRRATVNIKSHTIACFQTVKD